MLLNVLFRFTSIKPDMQCLVFAWREMFVGEFFDALHRRGRCRLFGLKVKFDTHDDPDFGRCAFVDFASTAVDSWTGTRKLSRDRSLQRDERGRVIVPVDPQGTRRDCSESDHQSDNGRTGNSTGTSTGVSVRQLWAHAGMFRTVQIYLKSNGGMPLVRPRRLRRRSSGPSFR